MQQAVRCRHAAAASGAAADHPAGVRAGLCVGRLGAGRVRDPAGRATAAAHRPAANHQRLPLQVLAPSGPLPLRLRPERRGHDRPQPQVGAPRHHQVLCILAQDATVKMELETGFPQSGIDK